MRVLDMDVTHNCVCRREWPGRFVVTSSRSLRLSTKARKLLTGRRPSSTERCGRATERRVSCSANGNRGQDRDLSAKAVSVGYGDSDAGFQIVDRKTGSRFDKEIARMAIPTALTSLLFPLASSVDAAIVGRLGLAQLSGVGLAGMFFSISQMLFQFLAQLSTPAIAQANARGNSEEVARTMVQNISLALGVGALLGLSTFSCAEGIVANVMKPAAAVYPFAVQYLKMVALAGPASLMMMCLSGIYRGLQDTKSTLGASIASATVNLGLDCLFVLGLGWGVTGAGLATVISLYASALFLFVRLFMKGYVKPADFATPPSMDYMLPLLIKGMALAVRSLVGYGLIFMGTVLMGRTGVTESAAFEIARHMAILGIASYSSLEMSTQALCAKYLGKQDFDSARQVMSRLLSLGVTASAIVGMLMITFSKSLAGLYTTNSLVVDQVVKLAPVLFFALPLDACAGIMDGALLASHQSNFSSLALITTSSIGVCTMLYFWQANALSLFLTWVIIKYSFVGRGIFGYYRLFLSKTSPYKGGPRAVPS